ncbi:MAG: helicase-related protein [Bacteroidota bacterium]
MFKPRDYQLDIANRGVKILRELNLLYLAMQVRTGKTFTALMTAHTYGAKKVLFLTVKKAIGGIEGDIEIFGKLDVEVLSMESAHKATGDYDLIILDEAHGIGAFPKPSKRANTIREIAFGLPIIYLSGTPNPESLSQLFHQFWISSSSPWCNYSNFYKWAKEYVKVKQRMFNGRTMNDYSNGIKDKIQPVIDRYFITFTQAQANFKCEVNEHILKVRMSDKLMQTVKDLQEDKVIFGGEHTILADTPVKLMTKVHQLCSGTIITEEGNTLLFDDTKVNYIKEYFSGKKLAIFYKYKGEYEMLKKAFPETLTQSIENFNINEKSHIALQIKAGSTGINLSQADAQVFLNIDFSSRDYIQARARQQTQDRESCDVYFIFSERGIEEKIYKILQKKESFTSKYFLKAQCITF